MSGLITAAVVGTAATQGVKAYGRSQQSKARKEAYVPEAPEYKTAEDSWAEALEWAKTNFPNEFGSRESALGDLATPESTTAYYEGHQPTSFEQALANQHFANVWPGTKAEISGALSNQGMEYSPLRAEMLGDAYGNLGFDIGSYLANQSEGRATTSLDARLQADPRAIASPYLSTDINQSNLQTEGEWDRALRQADIEYWKASEGAADRTATASGILSTVKAGASAYGAAKGGAGGSNFGNFMQGIGDSGGSDININRPSATEGWNPPTTYNPNSTGRLGTNDFDLQQYYNDIRLNKQKEPTPVY